MTHREPSALVIVGTGAMACLFAARLSAAGIPVTMLGSWAAGLQALRQRGVCVVDETGREQCHPVAVRAQAEECCPAPFALVLVKSWQTGAAARQLAACLAPDGLALTLQNGLGNREELALVLGSERVVLGVTTEGATLLGPGQVRPAGAGVTTLSQNPRLAPLARMLRQAGFDVDTSPDPTALLWGKLVINAAINPLTALLGVPNGELLERPPARRLLGEAAREAAAVAAAQGVLLTYTDPATAAETVARRTAANRSSMLQDVLRGAPTEIDAINGAIVAAGQEAGLPTPIHRTLWQLVKALEHENHHRTV